MQNIYAFLNGSGFFIRQTRFLKIARLQAYSYCQVHLSTTCTFELKHQFSLENGILHPHRVFQVPSCHQNITSKVLCRMNGKEVDGNENEDSAFEGTTMLATQVGGHRFDRKAERKLGMLDRGDGTVLKALQNPPRGTRELAFYQDTYNLKCKEKVLRGLRNFLPNYYGTETRDDVTFLVMENLTYSFHEPNVLDIKMGRVTYDPEASPEKQQHEISKYLPLEKLGFQITGMMIRDNKTGAVSRFEKDFCRSLTADNIKTEGLGQFFGLHNGGLRKDVLDELVQKLQQIENWFLVQKKYAFYASSLLIVYSSRIPCGTTASSPQPANSTDSGSQPAGTKRKRSKKPSDEELSSRCKVPRCSDGAELNIAQQARKGNSPDSNSSHELFKVQEDSSIPDKEEITVQKEEVSPACHPVHKKSLSIQEQNATTGKDKVDLVQVKMIDFAHVFPSSEKDENYLFGLQNLIRMLEDLRKM